LLAPDALERSRSQVILTVGGLRDHLAELGYRLEVHTSKAFRLEHPERTLEALLGKSPADLWVLHLSTLAMQAWFARHGAPCLVYGSTHEGIELPCVDVDYAVIVRHAVGQLLGKGHRHLALMLPDQRLYGNQQGEAAFREAVDAGADPDRRGSVIKVPSEDPETVCRELRRALRRAEAPTAMILWRVHYIITAYSYVRALGFRVPEDLSLICTDDSSVIDWLVPAPARYAVHPSVIIQRLFRGIHEILTVGPVSHSRVMILPEWRPGASLVPPSPRRQG
jgi:DNA-binding LacI/PurR family transcriptional regulator